MGQLLEEINDDGRRDRKVVRHILTTMDVFLETTLMENPSSDEQEIGSMRKPIPNNQIEN